MKRVKSSKRLIGWEAIGAVLGVSASRARERRDAEPGLAAIIGQNRMGRPIAWEHELISYDGEPPRARKAVR